MARPKKIISESRSTSEETSVAVAVEEKKVVDSSEVKEIYIPKTKKEQCMEKLRPYIEEETKLVKGRFRNYETPGGTGTVQMVKYPGIPAFQKTMQDGELYEIPLYVARFLNGVDVLAKGAGEKTHTCSYPVHGFKWDPGTPMPKGQEDDRGIPVPIIGVAKRVRRFGFESMEFDKAI
jgi:hypothetical protein